MRVFILFFIVCLLLGCLGGSQSASKPEKTDDNCTIACDVDLDGLSPKNKCILFCEDKGYGQSGVLSDGQECAPAVSAPKKCMYQCQLYQDYEVGDVRCCCSETRVYECDASADGGCKCPGSDKINSICSKVADSFK